VTATGLDPEAFWNEPIVRCLKKIGCARQQEGAATAQQQPPSQPSSSQRCHATWLPWWLPACLRPRHDADNGFCREPRPAPVTTPPQRNHLVVQHAYV
jgi:hypothetical protein